MRLVTQVSAAIGTEFFQSLVKNLAQALDADCIYLGEFVGGQMERVRTLAAWVDQHADGTSEYYALAGAVAAQVATGESWSSTRGVLKKFPSDALLAELDAQACIAVPMLDARREALGVIMAIFRHPLPDTRLPKSTLELFAPRATAELKRKQSDEALRESEQRYHVFISQNTDAMWRIEFETPIPTDLPEDEQIERIHRLGYLAECNDALAKLLGSKSADQLIGTSFDHLVQYADPNVDEHLRAAIRSGYRFSIMETSPVDLGSSSRRFLRTHWGIVENGVLQRIWGTNRDITDLRRTEEALQASVQRMSELLENVHLLTVMWDKEGSITFCNDYLLRLTGWKTAEIAGKNWFDLMVPPEEREKLKAEFVSAAMNSSSPHSFESTLVGKDGHTWFIAWQSTVLRDSEGTVTGFGGIGKDVTVQSMLDAARRQSQKLNSIERSLAKIVHDFSGLLTTITGYSTILLQGRSESDPAYTPLSQIKAAAGQGTALTQQLLAFTRQQMLHPELINLNPLIIEFARTLQPLLPDDIQLDVDLEPELRLVRADSRRFHQVLLNLTANAREAMPHGGRLAIYTSNIEVTEDSPARLAGIPCGNYVLLGVSDSGVGMSEEAQAHLFEPFYTTKEQSKRAGLGLSTVYGIVHQSGGYIVVQTEPGNGSVFEIYLPRVRPAA